MRSRPTVLIKLPAGIEALVDQDAQGTWPRSVRLARIVHDVHAHPTHRERLAQLSHDLSPRAAVPSLRDAMAA